MPKICRKGIPAALLRHLFDRIRERAISENQLGLLLDWIEANPEVPQGKCFKRFPEITVCGEGELVKTFLRRGQIADGAEVISLCRKPFDSRTPALQPPPTRAVSSHPGDISAASRGTAD